MIISRNDFLSYYWAHYLICEKDLGVVAEYVALREDNLNVCSERIAQLYLTAVNGVESVLKLMYPDLRDTVQAKEFAKVLLADSRFDSGQAVQVIAGQGLAPIAPFEGMDGTKSNVPSWWGDHTDLKHNRMEYFEKASLKNLLNAMAAYFYLCNLFMVECCDEWLVVSGSCRDAFDSPDERSSFFDLQDWEPRFPRLGSGFYANESIYLP